MNAGVVIGTIAIVVGIASLAFALSSRVSTRTSVNVLSSLGIPLLFLCSAEGFWSAYVSKDWAKCVEPTAFLFLGINAFLTRRQSIELIDSLLRKRRTGPEAGEPDSQ